MFDTPPGLLAWIANLVLSFALVGELCALFFGCTMGEGIYAAFCWWLYHLNFLLVIGGILLLISMALGIAVANR